MAGIVRVTNAVIHYDNGDRLQVQANGDGRYRWALIREGRTIPPKSKPARRRSSPRIRT